MNNRRRQTLRRALLLKAVVVVAAVAVFVSLGELTRGAGIVPVPNAYLPQ